MRRSALSVGALLGGLTGLPLIALMFLGQQLAGLPFLPFDLFDWLARTLPGGVIVAGIDTMVRVIQALGLGPISDVAKRIEQGAGIVLVLALCALAGALTAWLAQRGRWQAIQIGAVLALAASLVAVAVELSLPSAGSASPWAMPWLILLVGAWGVLQGASLDAWLAQRAAQVEPPPAERQVPGLSRRRFLVRTAGGSLALAALAAGVGWLLAGERQATGAGQSLAESTPSAGTAVPEAAPPIPTVPPPPLRALAPVPGTRSELTNTDDFYRIDIDTLPPVIRRDSWVVEVRGLFDRPRPLTLSDLMAFPAVTQPVTQSCISNPTGGDLISTGYYTGARLIDVLKALGLRPETNELALKAADGFYESVEHADMIDPRTLLVYGLNGDTLPIEHGFPLRIFIPNRYGMKQPKWIISMEAIDHAGKGYWVDRGWDAEARPQIVSVIDSVARDQAADGHVPVGGIAWAGDRGISKVEVQVDDGPWSPADLLEPPLSGFTWVLWRYGWPATPGQHTLRVRAVDGHGNAQIADVRDTFPAGATGYHSVTATA